MAILKSEPATVFSALLDKAGKLTIAVDKDVAAEQWYGCSDGTTTGYMKVGTDDILRKFLPFAHHAVKIAEV